MKASAISRLPAALFLVLALGPAVQPLPQWRKDSEEVRCPSFIDNRNCDCAAAPDGLDFTCTDASPVDLTTVIGAARFVIKKLDVISLDANVTCICEKIFANGSVQELHIQTSNLSRIEEMAFEGTANRLESLLIQNSKLKVSEQQLRSAYTFYRSNRLRRRPI